MAKGENRIAASGLPTFFALAQPVDAGMPPHPLRTRSVRVIARSLGGFQKEAMVQANPSADRAHGWRLVCDEGPYLNGHDAAPCPLAFFSVGLAAGYQADIAALAQHRGIALRNLRVSVESWYTSKGSMAARSMVGGAEAPEIRIEADCAAGEAALQALAADALRGSGLTPLLLTPMQGVFSLLHNGRSVMPAHAAGAPGSVCNDPSGVFDAARPLPDAPDLVVPLGPTPRKAITGGTTAAGSSLADSQDRRLNIGAVAHLREDGISRVVQLQNSPWGTSFQFLADPQGALAPDPQMLVAAGIAFCFMTQFGRFAAMTGAALARYSIVQDIHFGAAGAPFPAIETHVFLETPGSEDVAQDMLRTAEQTCFLHALCRTPLRPRLSVGQFRQ